MKKIYYIYLIIAIISYILLFIVEYNVKQSHLKHIKQKEDCVNFVENDYCGLWFDTTQKCLKGVIKNTDSNSYTCYNDIDISLYSIFIIGIILYLISNVLYIYASHIL